MSTYSGFTPLAPIPREMPPTPPTLNPHAVAAHWEELPHNAARVTFGRGFASSIYANGADALNWLQSRERAGDLTLKVTFRPEVVPC